jgi:hypothetical protein
MAVVHPSSIASRAGLLALASVLVLPALGPGPAGAGEDGTPFPARGGLDLAGAAARAWEADAFLVYVENDEAVGPGGRSVRWGYLFYSPARDEARAYSVQDGKIVVAVDLDFQFEAPPVPASWIDSDVALAAADGKAGREYRDTFGGTPATILLMRGAFHDKEPDMTTWTIIYTSPRAPSLFVMVDARTGKVKRTWSG